MKVLYATVLILMSSLVSASPGNTGGDFVNIFDSYCFAYKDHNAASAEKNLERSGKFRNPLFEDAYEIFIGSVDYAVTPQNHDCTTDVLVKRGGQILFSQTQIMSRLISRYGLKETQRRIFQDVAMNNRNTKIQQTDFIGSTGHRFRMLYPLDNQDSYYMTFTIDW